MRHIHKPPLLVFVLLHFHPVYLKTFLDDFDLNFFFFLKQFLQNIVCSCCNGAWCLLSAMLWTEGKYLRWSPPGNLAAHHWSLTLSVHRVLLLNPSRCLKFRIGWTTFSRSKFHLKETQRWGWSSENQARDGWLTLSFKEPIATVINTEWAVPRWQPRPFRS